MFIMEVASYMNILSFSCIICLTIMGNMMYICDVNLHENGSHLKDIFTLMKNYVNIYEK